MLTVTLLVAEGGLSPWVLVPVFWIWVNTHGSFPLGLVRARVRCGWGGWPTTRTATVERRCLLWAVGAPCSAR